MTSVVRGRHGVPARSDPTSNQALGRIPRRDYRPYIALNGAAMMAIAAVAIGIIGILYLIQTSQVAGLGYELSHQQAKHDELALENSRLGYQVARYESLDTVEQVAIGQLGMEHVDKYRFIEVQRPSQDDLPSPPAERARTQSLWDRIVTALLGTGHSDDAATPTRSNDPARNGASAP